MRRRIVPTLARQSDHELVARTSRGDVLALGELFDRHGGLAYGIALRVTGEAAVAAAAVQDAFEQVWSGAATIGPRPTDVVASIVRLARRSAIALRSSLPELEAPAPERNPPRNAEGRRAHAALATLAPDQRTVIDLAYYRGVPETGVAELLSLTIDTVRGLTAGAFAGLRVAE
jgi:RNA polymerase sigma-70 factor, ECF subfamily